MPNIAGQYIRRSVERDVEEFAGWPKMLSKYNELKKEEGYDVAQVYGATFLTGGRINESLNLKPGMFTFKTEVITLTDGREIARDVFEVNRMPLEKHYKKQSHFMERLTEEQLPKNVMRRLYPTEPDAEGFYERKRFVTEKIWETRKPFDIPTDEVPKEWRTIHEDLKWHIDVNKGEPFLFPSRTKHTHMSDSYVWKIFDRHGFYPHWLRAQRASCLISWNGLSMEQMMEWMSWEELKTAMHYGKMGKSKLLSVFKRFE